MASRANKYYNSFEQAAKVTKSYADQLHTAVNKMIRENYETMSPFTLNALVSNKINRVTKTMINVYDKAYREMMMDARKTATDTFAPLSKAQRSRMTSQMKPIVENIKMTSKRLQNDAKAMLIGNISGTIDFPTMVKGLQTLYPKYSSQVYNEVNTALQQSFKASNFEKAQSAGMEFYSYDGPNDAVTRPYCKNHVGKVYTAAEAVEIQATLMTLYNCRHQLNAISEEQYLARK